MIQIGDTAKTTFTIRGEGGEFASEVIVHFLRPDGTTVATKRLSLGEITNAGAGKYVVKHKVDEAGMWKVLAIGTVGGDDINRDRDFYVRPV